MSEARPDTWMPLFWGDYSRDTGHLNNAGHGAYMMLIKHYWCTGAPLRDDDDELWRIACCDSKREWLKVRDKVVRLFKVADDGLLRHSRVERELARASANVTRKSVAGSKGAQARWQQNATANGKRIAPALAVASERQCDTMPFANASSQSSKNPPLPPIERDASPPSPAPDGRSLGEAPEPLDEPRMPDLPTFLARPQPPQSPETALVEAHKQLRPSTPAERELMRELFGSEQGNTNDWTMQFHRWQLGQKRLGLLRDRPRIRRPDDWHEPPSSRDISEPKSAA